MAAIKIENRKVNGVEEEAKLNFWAGKETCWDTCHCPEMIKAECPATQSTSFCPAGRSRGLTANWMTGGRRGRIPASVKCARYTRNMGMGNRSG